MKNVEGYVCVMYFQGRNAIQTILFGKNNGNGQGLYEAIESNNFLTFESKIHASRGLLHLIDRNDFHSGQTGLLKMKIAESLDDIELLRNSKSLVVIWNNEGINFLLGPIVDGCLHEYPLPGAKLKYTNYTTYTSSDAFDRATYLLKEVNRQAGCPATLCDLHLIKNGEKIFS